MSKSKTPRTDAAYYVVQNPGEPGMNMVKADFACELELQLAKLRDRCARLKRQRDWLKLNHVSAGSRQGTPLTR